MRRPPVVKYRRNSSAACILSRRRNSDLVEPLKYILILIIQPGPVGCSGNDELPDIAADTGEQQMYEEAQRYLRGENYDLAVRSLQLLESRYPFGKYAEQAQLELIYAHYNAYEHEAAVEAADRFIRLHPQHPNVDYAYYMKGLAAYTGNEDIFAGSYPPTHQARYQPRQGSIRRIRPTGVTLSRQPLCGRCQGAHGIPAQPAGPA